MSNIEYSEEDKWFDGLLNMLVLDFHTRATTSIPENNLIMYYFNPRDKSHLTLLQVGIIVNSLFDIPITIQCKFFDRFRLRHYLGKVKYVKFTRKTDKGMNCINYANRINDYYRDKMKSQNVLEVIYDKYYSRGNANG